MRAHILVDDNSGVVPGEHGLSLLVETGEQRFMVDFGSTDLFLNNAKELGLNLDVDFCVISHNHSDHNGGARAYLAEYKNAKIYLSNETHMTYSGEHFPHKKLGMDKKFYSEFAKNLNYVDLAEHVGNVNIYRVPLLDRYRRKQFKFISKNGILYEDDFKHELTVCVLENGVLNIISPCSHKGIVGIVRWCNSMYSSPKHINIIGGLHFVKSDGQELNLTEEEIRKTAIELKNLNIENLYLGHCTGNLAIEIMKEVGLNVHAFSSGMTIDTGDSSEE